MKAKQILKARQMLYDPTHPLNDVFQKLLSGRRLKVPLAKKNLFKKSFIPSDILILNANFNVLYTSFIPYTYCTDSSNLICLPILVNIINVITLCLFKERFKEYYLLIYYLEYLFIYLIYLRYQF